MEAQVQDRADLDIGQSVSLTGLRALDRLDEPQIGRDLVDRPFARGQFRACLGGARRSADHPHDLVEVRHRDDQAEQDVRPVARLRQFELRPARDDLFAELDERFEEILEVQQFGATAADREHVRRERPLRGRVPPQLVQHDLGRRIALQLDDDPDAFAVRFVANVADTLDPLVLRGLGDLFDERVLALLIGDFGQHDRLAIAAPGLHLVPRPQDHRSAPGVIGRSRARPAQDDRTRWEIGAGDDLDQLLGRDHRIVEIGETGVDDLAQVMRRDVRRHADRDAARTVDEQVREPRGQDGRFAFRPVVVRLEIDRILVEILHQIIGGSRQPRLGIAHRGGGVGIHRSEIALTIDQRQPHRPVLRHPRERFVDRTVAVRVIFTDHVTDDTRRFAIGPVEQESRFLRRKQDAAVDRLQPVANVGQRARDDDGHRIVEIARLHFIDDRDRRDVGGFGEGGLVGQDASFRIVTRES